ncbi:MAG TPA: helicase C-terminal domain-containing protein, partial [Lacunisphaera sp.]|nr:helicase C-terminal domain-containing protein [Lacunisphaera sp.]
SGLAQTVALTAADQAVFKIQLERVADFLDLRRRARERLSRLQFQAPFTQLRPGQETTRADLDRALGGQHGPVFFEAPTGFGKTGVLLESALGQLRAGHFERLLYLTSKSTGQFQVVRTLAAMTPPASGGVRPEARGARPDSHPQIPNPTPPPSPKSDSDPHASSLTPHASRPAGRAPHASTASALAVWHVRNKAEHCINHTFHCVREECAFLDGAEARWPESGLARFYLFENEPRDLETLRAAGRAARICPYEITRAALAFNDVWIGDYNYVFAPRNRGLFSEQPGFDPARTLLVIDEAHNLPSRVADAHSHVALAEDARGVLAELDHVRASSPLLRAWESWALLLAALAPGETLDPALEADITATLGQVADALDSQPPDFAALGPHFAGILWQTSELVEWLANDRLKKLLWCPRAGELHFTCFDAADAIGETLRAYGGVVFASATLSPIGEYAEACGLRAADIPTAATPRPAGTPLSRGELDSGSPLKRGVARSDGVCSPVRGHVLAHTPWREGAYDVAFDARVNTSFQQRAKHHATTAATVEALHAAAAQKTQITNSKSQTAQTRSVAVFFPSYAYAEAITQALERGGSVLRVALQPRLKDLAAQAAWVEESLALSDALFLVLGSSFAESVDLLGGRVTHAMVVGPALPEVNAVQRARLAEFSALGREEAFRRVYQIPGMTKVNQALGRLVRAPGQRARVILHCQRFLEPGYAQLLAPDYQLGTNLLETADLDAWLAPRGN